MLYACTIFLHICIALCCSTRPVVADNSANCYSYMKELSLLFFWNMERKNAMVYGFIVCVLSYIFIRTVLCELTPLLVLF